MAGKAGKGPAPGSRIPVDYYWAVDKINCGQVLRHKREYECDSVVVDGKSNGSVFAPSVRSTACLSRL
jgi:hypothetical protein